MTTSWSLVKQEFQISHIDHFSLLAWTSYLLASSVPMAHLIIINSILHVHFKEKIGSNTPKSCQKVHISIHLIFVSFFKQKTGSKSPTFTNRVHVLICQAMNGGWSMFQISLTAHNTFPVDACMLPKTVCAYCIIHSALKVELINCC